jgi:acetate kinase
MCLFLKFLREEKLSKQTNVRRYLSRRPSLENVVDDNVANEGVISTAISRVAVHVIHTDEEQMIARSDLA